MKIAIVVGDITSTGGIERAMSRVSNLFCLSGHDVTIISLFRGNNHVYYDFSDSVKIIFLSEEKYATSKQGGIIRLMMFIKNIHNFRKILRSKKMCYDVFIGCGFPINVILALSSLSKKTIASEHTFYNYYSSIIVKFRNLLYKRFACVTSLTKKDTELFALSGVECMTIPNPLSFTSDKVSDLSANKIIAVGRLSPEKGFEDLIDIMPEIFAKHPEWSLNILGEGYMRPLLEHKIKQLNLGNNVFLKGNVKDIKQEYLQSSIFVLSSKFEGFAIVLLEAAACGLPIISYDCPNGPREILSDDKGILVHTGEKTELKRCILTLIENPLKMKYYAAKKNEILTPFGDDTICRLWENALEKVTLNIN